MEDEKEKVGAEATTENTGAAEATETKIDYAEMMKTSKELQSFVDSQKTQAMKTAVENARTKWEQEIAVKKAEADKLAKMDEDQKKDYQLQEALKRAEEAERKLSARDLETETLKQARNRGIPLELIDSINFDKEDAESITKKLDIFEKSSKSIREKAINEYSGENPPQTGDRQHEKSLSELKTYAEIEEYYKKHPEAN